MTLVVCYLINVIFLIVWARREQRLAHKTHTRVNFLPICCGYEHLVGDASEEDKEMSVYSFLTSMTALLKSDVRVPADTVGREETITEL